MLGWVFNSVPIVSRTSYFSASIDVAMLAMRAWFLQWELYEKKEVVAVIKPSHSTWMKELTNTKLGNFVSWFKVP